MPKSVPTAKQYRLNPRRRYAGKLLLLLVAGLVVGHQWWGVREGERLAAEVAALRQAGEPLLSGDFRHPPANSADNSAVDLRRAAASLPGKCEEWEYLDTESLASPLTPGESERARRVIDRYASALSHVRAARAKAHVDWGMEFASPVILTPLPDLNSQRELANFLGLAVLQAHDDGDDAAALGFVDDLCFLARMTDEQPFSVAHNVATGVGDLAAERLIMVAPTLRIGDSGGGAAASPEEVRGVIGTLLDARPITAGLVRALRGERAWQYDTVRELVDGRLTFQSLQPCVRSEESRAANYAARHLLKPMLLADGTLMLHHARRAIEAASAPDWPAASGMIGQPREELGHVWQHLLAYTLTPDYRRMLRRHHMGLTTRRLAAAALAVRWYASEHDGRLPASLEELVPRYLPTVPLDAMTRSLPLGYSPDPGRPIVYSVGDNGIDNGGDDAPLREHWGDDAGTWARWDVVAQLRERPRRTIDVRLGDPSLEEEVAPGWDSIPTPPWAGADGD